MDTSQKEFEMKCFIDDIGRIGGFGGLTYEESHFNILWKFEIQRMADFLSIHLTCFKENHVDHWEVKTETSLQVISKNGTSQTIKEICRYENVDIPEVYNRFGWYDFMTWAMLTDDFAIHGDVTIQANVRILEMVGFKKENLMNFDELAKEFSDIVLVVEDRKFYTSKLFLAFQSSYFKSLLLGDFAESKQSEVVLKDINPDDFQNFLELIHAESPIDGILHLAVLYDSPIAIKRCEEFLVKKSEKTLKVKLELSTRYNLKVLKVLTAFTSSAMDTSQKEFEIKCFIDDIDRLEEGIEHTVEENHFNIPWKLEIQQIGGYLSIYLDCLKQDSVDDWEVKTEITVQVLSKDGASQTIKNYHRYANMFNLDPDVCFSFGWYEFMTWDMLENNFAVNGDVTIQANVRILEMVGFRKENLKNFDELAKEFSDIVLVVRDRKFYTSKLFLGFQSSYFKSLLLGDFAESRQSEVVLKNINPDDFQNFLELIHGESPIDGILHLAVLYDSPTAIKRCEEFLVEKSKKTLKVKLDLSTRYNLKVLKVLAVIKSSAMDTPQKEFEIKRLIEDIDCMEEGDDRSVEEDHFNIPWKLVIIRQDGFLSINLFCLKENQLNLFEVKTETTIQVLSKNGTSQTMKEICRFGNEDCLPVGRSWGWSEFMTWDTLENDFAIHGDVTIQAKSRILEMVGFKKENLKNFDESMKEFSDIVLVVRDRKFYTLKLFLGFQSSYFKSLLLGDFAESKQSEVVLKDINPDDFQNFLELIHGESPIDGILHLAVLYDSPTAIKRCEEFLVEKSKKTLKVKLDLSTRYNLKVLKEKCMSEITSIDDIRSVMSDEMDLSISNELLKKCLSLC
ncbi:hypothetical protein GCK72_016747 [Caenorhabditis remanei]|uniref:BTB domain-containing protein n=1 Tax=Caenorhabditis remanei TaxID=31234 RepID=A0A6A5G5G6_CAERE|nr:hypothetical protein GCK72_016747 [Caenorhabditis remanei]KAF1750200.1 hypothetical protein GCK72_016747 [Caenorhabditis remanei]